MVIQYMYVFNLFIFHYIIILYYIPSYIYLLLFSNLFKGSSGKVKLERSSLQQLHNADGRGDSTIQDFFFEAMLMLRIDGVRSCLEGYISTFSFFFLIYVY